jgi:hypothetical protein
MKLVLINNSLQQSLEELLQVQHPSGSAGCKEYDFFSRIGKRPTTESDGLRAPSGSAVPCKTDSEWAVCNKIIHHVIRTTLRRVPAKSETIKAHFLSPTVNLSQVTQVTSQVPITVPGTVIGYHRKFEIKI